MAKVKFQINQLNYNKFKFAAIFSFAAVFLSGIYFLQPFSPDNSYAATHTDEASGKYNNTEYSLTTTVSDLNLELKTLPTGTSSTYGSQTVNVKTNAPGGYILYMSTSGDLTNNNTSSDDKISSITGNNTTLDTNTWGYTSESLLSPTSTALSTNPNEAAEQSIWNKLPVSADASLTSVASSTSETEESGEDSTLYYGIKADSSLDDGDYQGTITYTTIANDATSDTLLSIEPASGTAGQATPVTITTSLMTTSSGISASDISAKVGNYTCSSVSITSTAPLTFTCSVTATVAGTYNVEVKVDKYNKTYTKTSAYEAKTAGITNNMYMQDITPAMCAATPVYDSSSAATRNNTTFTVKDKRDNQTYRIRRLYMSADKSDTAVDTACWMVDNLKLTYNTLSSAGTSNTLTSSNTNISSNFTIPRQNTDSWCSSYNDSTCINAVSHIATSYGTLYSWSAAVANATAYSKTSGDQETSICPGKGSGVSTWHLPTGTTSGEWYKLFSAYQQDYNWSIIDGPGNSPANNLSTTIGPDFVYSGSRDNSSTNGQSTSASSSAYGYWWSSTAYNPLSSAYLAGVNGYGYIYGGTSTARKYGGFAARCVLPAS